MKVRGHDLNIVFSQKHIMCTAFPSPPKEVGQIIYLKDLVLQRIGLSPFSLYNGYVVHRKRPIAEYIKKVPESDVT